MGASSAVVLESPCAEERLARATAFLAARGERSVTVVGASTDAAAEVARRALAGGAGSAGSSISASFGWRRATLGSLAVELARGELAARGLVPVSGLALEAVCARVVHESRGKLGRLAPIEERPGLPRALARTVAELRLAGSPKLDDPDLTKLVKAFDKELVKSGLADRAKTLEVATAIAKKLSLGALVLIDVPIRTRAEHDFVRALAAKATAVFATVPAGDDRARDLLVRALGATVEHHAPDPKSPLERLQTGLFGESTFEPAALADGDAVDVLSAPGESRESVEIVRRVIQEAHAGTPLDRVAVLLRAPAYAAHLEEGLCRAKVPAFFARGTRKPDPAGRALLALLACAAEGLSARRFAEYLSLGEVPEAPDGAPPQAPPAADRIATPDEEALGALLGLSAASLEAATEEDEQSEPAPAPVAEEDRASSFGTLRAPRHWERLLVDAAVIGGRDRWAKRLDGLGHELEMDLDAYERKAEDGLAEIARRDLAALEALRTFALPLVDELAALPKAGTWAEWIEGLGKIAARAIRHPERVLAVLAELKPMGKVDKIDVTEVRLVLERRLAQLVVPSAGRRYGKVFVGTIDEARGLAFDVVFVPGLAEKIFPQKVVEDPLLLDDARKKLDVDLPRNAERSADERLALRLAVGAARRRVVLSYPRLDVEQARPRTPSFYGLEVLRVAEGELRGFEHLQRKAGERADARIGWPAPSSREQAIDEAEYDLALLESILKKKEDDCVGEAHYLLNANEHLARALRFRGRRWLRTWKQVDGLVDPPDEALAAIRKHALSARSFSPTALQHYAACPYRFLLSAVHRLAAREDPSAIEDLDPMTRGSLVHEVQFEVLSELRNAGLLPVTAPRLDEARAVLSKVLARVAEHERERLAPAIPRVWKDAIDGIEADLREWLRRMTEEIGWTPAYFELSFRTAPTIPPRSTWGCRSAARSISSRSTTTGACARPITRPAR
jgi:ATP-dependent helicase/nuclease subunit B